METPLKTATRLLRALEDLVSRESVLLRSTNYLEAVTIQERAGPLFRELARLADQPGVSALKPRVDALVERRMESWHHIDANLARMQGELARINEARGRLARIAPVYGARLTKERARFNAAA
jgi:hypothetical protein